MQSWVPGVVGSLVGVVFGALITTLNFKPRIVKTEQAIKQLEKNWDLLQPALNEINNKLAKISIDVAVLKSKRCDNDEQ